LLGDTYQSKAWNEPLPQGVRALSSKAVAAYLSGLKAAGTDKDWVSAFKAKVVGLYVNRSYYGEIYVEGDKISPGGTVLMELVEAVEKTNYSLLPPATLNRVPVVSMSFDAKEYEVEGVIEEDIFGSFPGKLKAEFKVWVKGDAWLIETTELVRTRGMLRSQRAGTANSTEICTLNVPINRVVEAPPANSPPTPFQRPPGGGPSLPVGAPIHIMGSTGRVVSNTMPLADDDEAIVPHLWLMFASRNYFQAQRTNRMTPAYRYDATGMPRSISELEAECVLMGGTAALPLRVNYYTGGGLHEGFQQAAYSVTGKTNFGGTIFPSGFVFEEYAPTGGASRYDMKVVRRAEVTVTAFRPVCSIKNFLPECDNGVVVHDMRLPGAKPDKFSYIQRNGVKWVSAADAKELAEGRPLAQKKSPVILIIIGVMALLPPVVIIMKSVKRKRPGRPPA